MAKNAQAGKPAKPHTPPPAEARSPATVEGGGAAAEPVITHLLVSSKREGFRRAGRPWSVATTLVEIGEFDESQVAALLAEPMFQAVAMTAEAAAAWVADQAA